MLVLTRKIGESIVLDGQIVVKVSQISGNRVKLCVEAPRECRVMRAEIVDSLDSESSGTSTSKSRLNEERELAAI